MKTRILLTAATILLSLLSHAQDQTAIELNFQGLLKNNKGESISNDSFQFMVKFLNTEAGKKELWMQEGTARTDEEGWISFSMPDLSPFMIKDGSMSQPLVIRLEFLPSEGTTWLNSGEDLMLTYTLTPSLINNNIHLKMTRMEGAELTYHLEQHLYVFKDEYPFANLTGGFLLTDAPPLPGEAVKNLRDWINPPADAAESTRGIKGGFPKGGYRKH